MTDVKLHDIGEGMTEAEIVRFFVKAGDVVSVDEPLLEVQTDKMTTELPSPSAGVVKEIKAVVGDMIAVGDTMLVLQGENEELLSEPDVENNEPTSVNITPNKTRDTEFSQEAHVLAAPYIRKIAKDYEIDIEKIIGTGPDGRVTEEDVHAFVREQTSMSKKGERSKNIPTASPAARRLARARRLDLGQVKSHDPLGRIRVEDVRAHDSPSRESKPSIGNAEEFPFRGIRRQIAKKMTQSMYTIPHVTHFDEVDVTDIFAVKHALKASDPDKNVSVAAFFIKAVQCALQEVPIFNAKLDEEREVIRLEKEYNIGIAVDTEEGLIVPVIKHVDQLSVLDIHHEMKRLTQKAVENKLTLGDMSGGTFTVSNVGPMGSTGATPIINYPEVGIMAFHKTKKMPVVRENDEIVIRQMMNVSMTFDHRVADGAKAVTFTNHFIEYIENPNRLLVSLT